MKCKMKVCRICLSQDGRLYPITNNGLLSLYHQLIGVVKLEEDVEKRLPQWVCMECGPGLMSYNKLRQKSLRSHQILCQLLDKASFITEADINKIDREKNNLDSNFSDHGIYSCDAQDDLVFHNEDDTDCKPKIEEFLIDFEAGDTSVLKTEQEYDTRLSDSKQNSESEHDIISDLEDVGHTSDSDSLAKLIKSDDEKFSLDVKKQVDKYLTLYNINSTGNVRKTLKKQFKSPDLISECAKNVKKSKSDRKKVKNSTEVPINEFFTVQILTLKEQLEQIERRKFSIRYIDAPFKCNECFKGFYTEVAFTRHKFYHSDKRGKFECKICRMRFRIQTSYHHHVTSHKAVYSCRKCPFTSSTKSVAIQHRLKHKGKVFKCPHCGVQFGNQSSYLSHVRIKHVSNFVCEFCGYSFVNAKGVALHKNLKHILDRDSKVVTTNGPACATCNIRFVSDEALITHLRVSHSQKTGRRARNDHGCASPASSSVICEVCGVKSDGGRAYLKHFRQHHPNSKPTVLPQRARFEQNCVCEQCGRVFKYKQNLQKHALLHTGQKPYQCDYCLKYFSTKPLVHSHIVNCHLPKKINTPKELFPCVICGKDFANSGNRTRHMVIHSDRRPFSCEVCGSSFKTKGELKAHTTHVHMKIPWPKKQARCSTAHQGAMSHL